MKPTKKQLDLLQVLNPHKETKVTQADAAKILGVTVRAIEYRMSNLKRRCPDTYQTFKQLGKDITAGQKALNRTRVVDPEDFEYFDIKERF